MKSNERNNLMAEADAYIKERRAERRINRSLPVRGSKESSRPTSGNPQFVQQPVVSPNTGSSQRTAAQAVTPEIAQSVPHPSAITETSSPAIEDNPCEKETQELHQSEGTRAIPGRSIVKGWVYVISNRAMPGLVKVGYSMKDPELRARELNHTGAPHPYAVEYEVLIEEPYAVEQRTHKLLSTRREAKEWFRCSPEEAIAAIKQIAGDRTINETYKRAEREKAEALHQRELRARETKLRRQQAEQEIEKRLASEESAIRQKYHHQFGISFPPRPFWNYWLGGSILAFIGISIMLPKATDGGVFVLTVLAGGILGAFLQSHFENKQKQSAEYLALNKQQEAELEAVRARVFACPRCAKQLRFDRAELLLPDRELTWSCPSCKATISPPRA